MEKYIDKDHPIIKHIVDAMQEEDFAGVKVSEFITEIIDTIVIEWDENSITTYIPEYTFSFNKETRDFNVHKRDIPLRTLTQLISVLTLLDALKSNGHIFISNPTNIQRLIHNSAYTNFTKRSSDSFWIYIKTESLSDNYQPSIKLCANTVDSDVSKLLERYCSATIFPSKSLEELYNHKFKSIEQRNFEKQLNKTNCSIGIAAAALIVSAIMPFVIMKCSPDTDTQVEKIESAIKSTKTEYPTKIEVSLPDTVTVKDIENRKIINNIHIDNEQTKDAQPE